MRWFMIGAEDRDLARRHLTLEKVKTTRLGKISIAARLRKYFNAVKGSPIFVTGLCHTPSFTHHSADCIICNTASQSCFLHFLILRRHPSSLKTFASPSSIRILQESLVLEYLLLDSGAAARRKYALDSQADSRTPFVWAGTCTRLDWKTRANLDRLLVW